MDWFILDYGVNLCKNNYMKIYYKLYKKNIIIITTMQLLYYNYTITIIWNKCNSFKNEYTLFYVLMSRILTYSS